jgi:predicted nucleotidyltransferase
MIIKRDQVLEIIAKHREQLKQLGVKSLFLFGSVARDEANMNSDVDLLVEFNRTVGLFEFIEVKIYLEDILGCSVDLGTEKALKEHLREPVFKDMINAL